CAKDDDITYGFFYGLDSW
nr:immunoglobulin heavy chain junction region [Macaca mulatta]MPN83949.1 immunoglobulin heavy chain junction region [Macaca mulatta]MPN84131.1 immunoglobulin heavy chain junction region [Macaca mulatta]MPN84136.1 immunoglobulin heavy chain junction region [Macaca mulatta]MPN84297.1 immunoglobulin heavy chain junction region [Macaca mulatta]